MIPFESFGTIPDFWQQQIYPLDWLGDTITTAPIRLQKGILFQSSFLPKNTLLFPNPEETPKQFDLIVYDLHSDPLDPYRLTFRAGVYDYEDEHNYFIKPHSESTEILNFNKEEVRTLMKVTIIQEPSNSLFRPVPILPESDLSELLKSNPDYKLFTLPFSITDRKEKESREPVRIYIGTIVVFDTSRIPENKDFVIQKVIENPKAVTIGRLNIQENSIEIDREAEETFIPEDYSKELLPYFAPIVCFVTKDIPIFPENWQIAQNYPLKSGQIIPKGAYLTFGNIPLNVGDLAAIEYKPESDTEERKRVIGYIEAIGEDSFLISTPEHRLTIERNKIFAVDYILGFLINLKPVISYTIIEPVY